MSELIYCPMLRYDIEECAMLAARHTGMSAVRKLWRKDTHFYDMWEKYNPRRGGCGELEIDN